MRARRAERARRPQRRAGRASEFGGRSAGGSWSARGSRSAPGAGGAGRGRATRIVAGVSLSVLIARLAVLAINATSTPLLGAAERPRSRANARHADTQRTDLDQANARLTVSGTRKPSTLSTAARPTPARPSSDAQREEPLPVDVLIPARNEAQRLPGTLPAVLAQGARSVTVLDDNSDDATVNVADRLGSAVRTGRPLPDGWSGKTWACQQLADAADHDVEYLLFTDADVVWSPGALGRLIDVAKRRDADLVTVFPRQLTPTVGERFITPLIDASVFGLVPTTFTRRPAPVVANGQVMLFRAASYRAIGGHAAVAGDLVEDVALARLVRDAGGRVTVCRGGGDIAVRMYAGYRDSIGGLAKSLPGLHGNSRAVMVACWATAALVWSAPWLLPQSPSIVLARVLSVADRSIVAGVMGRRDAASLAEGALGPVSPLLAVPAYLRALRRTVSWKGRSYS